MRITTNMLLRNYNGGLSKTLNNLDKARNTVLTQRNFNSVSEDPSAAMKAFRLRRSYAQNDIYLSNLESVQSKTESVSTSEMQIKKMLDEAYQNVLTAHTGTSGETTKDIVARSLRETAESIILSANTKFGDHYLFNGADTQNPPFELNVDANGKASVYYRGINVDTGKKKDGTTPPAGQTLDDLAKETLYQDIGFGLAAANPDGSGALNESTLFDTATSGLNLLGYGLNPDGSKKNMVTMLFEVADKLEAQPYNKDDMDKRLGNFKDNLDHVLDSITQLGTKEAFLKDTKERLETHGDNLNEQIVNLEDANMPEAITAYMWAQYAYNSALKVGNSVLSSSFIDFMN